MTNIKAACFDKCWAIAAESIADKALRGQKFGAVKNDFVATLSEEDQADTFLIGQYFKSVQKEAVRDVILNDRLRLDGRQLDEIRPIWSEVDYLPSAHAIESFSLESDQNPLCHGEAIAVGMICESYISQKSNKMSQADLENITSTIKSFYNFYELDESNYHSYIELMENDKKNESNEINFTLLSGIGRSDYNKEIGVDLILESLNYYNRINKG